MIRVLLLSTMLSLAIAGVAQACRVPGPGFSRIAFPQRPQSPPPDALVLKLKFVRKGVHTNKPSWSDPGYPIAKVLKVGQGRRPSREVRVLFWGDLILSCGRDQSPPAFGEELWMVGWMRVSPEIGPVLILLNLTPGEAADSSGASVADRWTPTCGDYCKSWPSAVRVRAH
jgi:hypothetical protein